MRFLHTADWQWGMPAHFLADEARARYKAARLDAVRRIGEIAVREQCAFVLVCGDLFDANQLSPETLSRSFEALRQIKVPVYVLPGNHDPHEPGSVYLRPEFTRFASDTGHVHVLTEPGITRVSDDVEIVAARLEALAPTHHGRIRILAGHGALDTRSPDPDVPYLINRETVRAALDEQRVHYVALGDRHSLTDLGLGGRAWYSGTPEVTAYDEQDPGHVLIVDLNPAADRCAVAAHRTGTWAFTVVRAQLDGANDVEMLDHRLRELPHKDTTAVRLALRGTLSLHEHARLGALVPASPGSDCPQASIKMLRQPDGQGLAS